MTPPKKQKCRDMDISFAKIHVPKMRSVFWKYFGFPASEDNAILTKNNVVCTLCLAVLRNHYNTTNIRAHMQSTHKAIFAELISTHGIHIPPRKTQKKAKPLMMVNYEDTIDCNKGRILKRERTSTCSSSPSNDDDSINLLGTPLTYEDTDHISKDGDISDVETGNDFSEKTCNVIALPKNEFENENDKSLAPLNITVDINPIKMPIEFDIEEALRRVILKDIQNVSSIYNSGMQEFITGFIGNQPLTPQCKMEASIRQLHNEQFVKLKDRIKVYSQVKLYSLSFDVWSNIENKQYVSIYFNNISEEFENQICDNLYMTVQLNEHTMFEQIFEEFNLENCSAAVINCNQKILNTYLSSNHIPIVYCFSHIVNTCIKEIFKIPDVSSTFDDVQDIITRYTSQISCEGIEIPVIYKEYPLTKLELLKFFCESVSWPDELEMLISKAKRIIDTVQPIEITLDTLREEDIPLSSLFLPFADKIIQKHFVLSEYDDTIQQEIKTRVVSEFKRSVCSNNYLAVTTMLDPRFHKFLSMKNVGICLNILEKKYSQIRKQRGHTPKTESGKEMKNTPKTSRKSHLKLFFDVYAETPTKSAKADIFIEQDLRRYREDAFASLEESPLIWWNQWGNSYGTLKYLADAYNCILGFVNMNLKKSLKDQISMHRKRFMLTGQMIDPIIFLNKNYFF